MEVNYRNKSDNMKKLEKQSILKVINSLWLKDIKTFRF